ncbi:MAG TPA: phage protease [Phycisphaerae bacterium]|jgi:phage I-like protein|nr:hypothetical protein [Phycisphaerae bacterium]HOB74683.1 phage protease [Phycisphaerae bacterium]HOJ53604.1 phage protease [Phycisphaerae bacterium]HOL26329.1 phage protease [Phycisphaerae bacterium]HPP22518.1 phage protease [Phycisphaerae bacterium]
MRLKRRKPEKRAGAMGEVTGERVVLDSTPVPGGVPSRVLIAPWGWVASANGSFVVDEAAGQAVLAAFEEHGTDIPVDYEHQSLGGPYASPSGQAPAAGWIRALTLCRPGENTEPGLYADVEWTPGGRARLEAREYRYLSPAVIVRKSDRRVQALHSVALTNKPAIVGMRPIVNREELMTQEPMRTENETSESAGGAVVERLRLRLGLPDASDMEAVLTAASERLETLAAEVAQREARQRVEAAFRAGKLTGAQQEWAMSLALKDPAGFDEWLATAPVVVSIGRTEPPHGDEPAGGRNRAVVIASARAAYRAEPALAMLTSEEAWIEEALREAGMEVASAE